MNTAPRQPRRPQPSWQQSLQEASAYLGLGMQMALTMAFFVVGGYFLDRWLGTWPWLLSVGAVLGMAAIFVQLFRVVGQMNRQSQAQATRKKENSPEDPPDP